MPTDESLLDRLRSAEEDEKNTEPTQESVKELETFDKAFQERHLDRLDLQNKALKETTELRKTYSGKVFKFLVGWSLGVGLVLLLQGFKVGGFDLPESVLNVLVGSATANVVALVSLVVKGLFPKDISLPEK
ncbi:MAG: hypothetical protein ACE5G9_13770 [Nitrospinales bacterium]